MAEIRMVQFFKLSTANGQTHLYQNYFVNEAKVFNSLSYSFVPFRADGAMAAINGDNPMLKILFPSIELILRLVEAGQYNHLSTLELTTAYVDAAGSIIGSPSTDFYTGIGAGFSETTVELRFRSAVDSIGTAFPARTLTRQLVGPLPLNSELYLR